MKASLKESQLEKRLAEMVKQHGGLCYKFISPDEPGVPDRIVITSAGRTIYVELKTEIGTMQRIQQYQHERFREHNADVRVIKGLDQVKEFVKEIFEKAG
jgi:hypothetical protein